MFHKFLYGEDSVWYVNLTKFRPGYWFLMNHVSIECHLIHKSLKLCFSIGSDRYYPRNEKLYVVFGGHDNAVDGG